LVHNLAFSRKGRIVREIPIKFISTVKKISIKRVLDCAGLKVARFLLYLLMIICFIVLPFLISNYFDRGYEINGLATANFSLEDAPGIDILVMGDSLIIETDWVERFGILLREKYKFTSFGIYKSGKSGATAEYGDKRIVLDLIKYNPDIVIIAFGTNDVNVTELDIYREHMEGMVEKSKKYGAEVFINFIGPFEPCACKEEYIKYNDIIKIISYDYGVRSIDVSTPLMRNTEKYLADNIHYSYSGSEIVARKVFGSVTRYIKDERILDNL